MKKTLAATLMLLILSGCAMLEPVRTWPLNSCMDRTDYACLAMLALGKTPYVLVGMMPDGHWHAQAVLIQDGEVLFLEVRGSAVIVGEQEYELSPVILMDYPKYQEYMEKWRRE
ncbi:hypothetical protein ES708_29305 [subsurface metagenome]